jgi:hypothetical protein
MLQEVGTSLRDSEPKLKWYQFRLASLFTLIALVAFVLGIVVSSLPNRIAEEFDRVPDELVAFSWMAMPKRDTADKDRWVIKTRFYAERPFDFQIHRRATSSIDNGGDSWQNLGVSTRSRSQVIGHNAVLDCELTISEDCLTVAKTTDKGRTVIATTRISDTRNIRWLGIPAADLPHSMWRTGPSLGPGALCILECGVGTKPEEDCAESFYCALNFVATEK